MRLATFNVENMFSRAKAMNLDDWSDGKAVLEDFKQLNDLINEPVYTAAVQTRLWQVIDRNPGLRSQGLSAFIRLQEVRGKLIKRPTSGPEQIVPAGRDDWVGWFELVREQTNTVATDNTARVIAAIDPDVLAVVEAENRPTLKLFNETIVHKVANWRFDHVMLIDGNDERGIDVGILLRRGHTISSMRTHCDDEDATGPVFSRDCAVYFVATPAGNEVVVLVNHLKSKGYGSASTSNAKRLRQATRIREIYDALIAEGHALIAIVGDFNDTPDSAQLAPLLAAGDLVDVMAHAAFTSDGRPGTYANGTKSNKIDYLLMSPALAATLTAAHIERRGVWGGVNGTLFPHFDEVTKAIEAASDHAALVADFAV